MTPERAAPHEDPPSETDAYDEALKRLVDADAPEWQIAAASLDSLEHLLDIEHPHLAVWHACRYGSFWDDGRKLELLERMWRLGMESFAIQLCHRWGLSELCKSTTTRFYHEMFPKLPPRTTKGDSR